jgi:hypothetical protein
LAVVAWCAAVAAAPADDGGSGTYSSTGPSYDFDLVNDGSTSWRFYYLVGPAGTVFVGGATQGEITIPCTAGQPDGSPAEIECGPVSTTGLAPGGQLGFVATLAAPVACGSAFQLFVSSTGSPPFTQVGAATPLGTCAQACTSEQAAVGTASNALGAAERVVQTDRAAWSKAPKARKRAALTRLRGAQKVDLSAATKLASAKATLASCLA